MKTPTTNKRTPRNSKVETFVSATKAKTLPASELDVKPSVLAPAAKKAVDASAHAKAFACGII